MLDGIPYNILNGILANVSFVFNINSYVNLIMKFISGFADSVGC
jgi:hypothetical protein